MFSSPTGGSRNRDRSLTKTLSKAALTFAGSGPPLHKQLKEAITEGNEEKAIAIYTSNDSGKSLMRSLHLSKPFPSKKNANDETPLHLTAKFALSKLFSMFLEYGGNPGVRNIRGETCMHASCAMSSNPFKREDLVALILEWRGNNNDGNSTETVPIDALDIDGNTALHLAAFSNLLPCVELLINYGARLDIINKFHLSACEMADKAGYRVLGTMIELAWLFMSVNQLIEDTNLYHKFSHDRQNARIILHSHSLTLARLVDFINQAVKFIAEALGETQSRAEVLLTAYAWDSTRLKKEYLANSEKVLASARLLPRVIVQSRESSSESKGDMVFGVSLADVYLDSAYNSAGPFMVLQDGKKVQYSIRTVGGKTGVYSSEKDHHQLIGEPFISETAHINPKATELCGICNDRMYEPCSVHHFISGNLVEAKHREFACNSGHRFCFGCWSDHLQAQVMKVGGVGVGCLPCPGHKCGEILDLQWAPVMLKSQELLNRLLAQRQRQVIDCIGLRWCPVPNCGLLVHVTSHSFSKKGDPNLPQSVVCANGHAFCLSCSNEAHSPCSCANLTIWQENVREESKTAGANTKEHNAVHVVMASSADKKCPKCHDNVHKEEGCNRMSCLKCQSEFCWICMQDWSIHADNQNGYFQCNRMIDQEALAARLAEENKPRSNSFQEEKADEPKPLRKPRSMKQILFVHHYTRFQAHGESMRLEAKIMEESVSRISLGLQASAEGAYKWLLGDDVVNPYQEKEETEDVFNHMKELNVSDIKDTVIKEYYLPKQECVEFLIDAFEELEKCRCFLRWSYPYALFEFDENFQKPSAATASNKSNVKLDENRLQFDLLQAALEASTERVSDIIARKRLRGTRSEIILAARDVKSKRIALENLVLGSAGYTDETKHLSANSANSSLTSWNSAVVDGSKNQLIYAPPAASVNDKSVNSAGHQRPEVSAYMTMAPSSSTEVAEDDEEDEEVAPYTDAEVLPAGIAAQTNITSNSNMQQSNVQQNNVHHSSTTYVSSTSTLQQSSSGHQSSTVHTSSNRFDAQHQNYELEVSRDSADLDVSPTAQPARTSFRNTFDTSKFGAQQSPQQQSQQQQSQQQLGYGSQTSYEQHRAAIELTYSEATAVEQMMASGYSQEEAIRTCFQRSGKPYNTNAVYSFPAPEYDSAVQLTESRLKVNSAMYESQRNSGSLQFGLQQQSMYIREQQQQQYQAPVVQQQEITVEQRLIGAKKDPDQEALEHAILLSQQESEYGVNMYDALTPADEPVIDEYIAQGFTREEAILIIFEEKYGKVASQQANNVTPAMPTVYNAVDEAEIELRSEEEEAEIARLMTMGYTREQAVNKIERDAEAANNRSVYRPVVGRAAESATSANTQSMYTSGNNLNAGNNRAASSYNMSAQQQSSGNNGRSTNAFQQQQHSAYEEEEDLSAAEAREVEQLMQQHMFSSAADAVDFVLSQRVSRNNTTTTSNNVNIHNNNNTSRYAPVDTRTEEEVGIDQLMDSGYSREQARTEYRRRQQATSSGVSVAQTTHSRRTSGANEYEEQGVELWISRGYTPDQAAQMHRQQQQQQSQQRSVQQAPPPPQQQEQYFSSTRMSPAQRAQSFTSQTSGDYAPQQGQQNQYQSQSQYQPQQGNNYNSYTQQPSPGPRRTADEQAMFIAILISEQESEFGINMYDSFTPADQPEIDDLVRQGFSSDEALQQLFERRYRHRNGNNGRVTGGVNNNASVYGYNGGVQNNGPPPRSGSTYQQQQNTPYLYQQQPPAQQQSQSYYQQSGAASQQYRDYPPGPPQDYSPPQGHSSQYNDTNDQDTPRRQSFFRASGIMSGASTGGNSAAKRKYSKSDVRRITAMGFSENVAIDALIANNSNVDQAIDSLVR